MKKSTKKSSTKKTSPKQSTAKKSATKKAAAKKPIKKLGAKKPMTSSAALKLVKPAKELGLGNISIPKNLWAMKLSIPAGPAGTSSERPLTFTLVSKTVSDVKVFLDYHELVMHNEVSQPSAPRKLGDWISVMVVMLGEEDQTATIDVTNGEPNQLVCMIPEGVTNFPDSRVVVAKWEV